MDCPFRPSAVRSCKSHKWHDFLGSRQMCHGLPAGRLFFEGVTLCVCKEQEEKN